MNKQDKNLHTIEQIKAMGNRILTKKGEEGLRTERGKTITDWVEMEPGLYYPVNAYVRD